MKDKLTMLFNRKIILIIEYYDTYIQQLRRQHILFHHNYLMLVQYILLYHLVNNVLFQVYNYFDHIF